MTLNKLKDELQIVSHRGLPSDFPENTMVGYREVMGLNVAMLEIDVHLTKETLLMIRTCVYSDNIIAIKSLICSYKMLL
ncbi:Glycerophosphoryl diester phosphodiesterase [Staphylococcus aureus]|nr:Glycerophosphoryl diester phosphodiesterase [Staphylococcus aureus]